MKKAAALLVAMILCMTFLFSAFASAESDVEKAIAEAASMSWDDLLAKAKEEIGDNQLVIWSNTSRVKEDSFTAKTGINILTDNPDDSKIYERLEQEVGNNVYGADLYLLQDCFMLTNFAIASGWLLNYVPEEYKPVILESDQDLEPKAAYLCYEDRWLLELVFNRYKSDECLDHTDVQGDFSVIGGEFINFISTVATCRIIRKAQDAGLLEKMSFGELMDDLSSAWRKTDAPAEPATDDDGWVHTLQIVFDELEALGLSKPVPKPEPKKRGRKPKPKDQTEQKPKRKRGRPRKDETLSAGTL